MLLLLHSLTRKRRTMPRQARKLSGTGIRHVILCRHSPAGKTDRCLFRSNTIIVANEMITRTVPVIDPLILRNGGIINLAVGKTFEAPIGAVVSIESGEIN